MTILSFLGYGIAVISLIFAFVQWKKINQLQNVLMESMNRNLALKNSADQARNSYKTLEDQISGKKQLLLKLEKNVGTLREENTHLKEKMEQEAAIHNVQLEEKARLVEKYASEAKSLTKQIIELDANQSQLKKKIREEMEATIGANTKEYKALEEKFKENQMELSKTKDTLKVINVKLKKQTEILEEINPTEYKKTKRKIKQYNQIFTVMRGQKEMAEERAENWEVALKQTSAWIVKTKKPNSKVPTTTSQLAATALELIHGNLVDDAGFDEKQQIQNSKSLEEMLNESNNSEMTLNTKTSELNAEQHS